MNQRSLHFMAGLHVIGGHGPRNVQIKAKVGYGRLIPCTKAASVAQSLKNNMQGGLQCRYNNICDVQVEISGKPTNIFFPVRLNTRTCYVSYFHTNKLQKNGRMKKLLLYCNYFVRIIMVI